MSDWSKFLGIPLWFWLFVLPTLISLVCLFLQNKLEKIFNPIWKILDKVYYYSNFLKDHNKIHQLTFPDGGCTGKVIIRLWTK